MLNLDLLNYRLIDLPWWGYVVLGFLLTQSVLLSVTVYLHRFRSHKALDLHEAVQFFFRMNLWLFTGMIEEEWVRIHRKHHRRSDRQGDPHSPHVQGKWIFPLGVWAYVLAAREKSLYLDPTLGEGIANDWWEHNFFRKYFFIPTYLLWGKKKYVGGLPISLALQVLLLGWPGAVLWIIEIGWIPFWAAGVINGLGHMAKERDPATGDMSKNLWWTSLFGGVFGEQHHKRHHEDPTSAKFSAKWYEVDPGWGVIKLLEWGELARVRKVRPKLQRLRGKTFCDEETVQAVVAFRFEFVARFDRIVSGLGHSVEARKGEVEHLREELTQIWENKKLTREGMLDQLRQVHRRLLESSHAKIRAFGTALAEYSLARSASQRT